MSRRTRTDLYNEAAERMKPGAEFPVHRTATMQREFRPMPDAGRPPPLSLSQTPGGERTILSTAERLVNEKRAVTQGDEARFAWGTTWLADESHAAVAQHVEDRQLTPRSSSMLSRAVERELSGSGPTTISDQ
ncbi:hypothetical protein [Pseudoduganella rhizocola]|uniref:hypothetical protein n=1 Tax=Pseudoduganella rhizocola TaxID=3382643 RepID=UPI0038B520B2